MYKNVFISCDWGTTAFRMRLAEASTARVLAEIKTGQGIAATYHNWKEQGETENRLLFYSRILAAGLQQLQAQHGESLDGVPIVLSGMASSSIGMEELPYKKLPFNTYGTDLHVHVVQAGVGLNSVLVIISGTQTATDVMRGEETKLVGCRLPPDDAKQLLIFPGTHCKHMLVQQGKVVQFDTYITGELFKLLSTNSVLAASVSEDNNLALPAHASAFTNGVKEGAENNLLNALFHVRTSQLFGHHLPAANYHYLSGLLIGNELKSLMARDYSVLTLVASPILAAPYQQALQVLGLATNLHRTDADEALVIGQQIILKHIYNE